MQKSNDAGKHTWVDPDAAPELTDEWFEKADVFEGETLIRRGRGRPKMDAPKRQVTVRLDGDVLDRLRATGKGWQGRLNEAVREWLDRH
jgi:uncharacterized protein (DUF4415 family)